MVAGGRKTLLQQALKLHKPFGDFVGIEFSGNTSFNSASTRHMCQLVSKMNGKRAFLVDTLALYILLALSVSGLWTHAICKSGLSLFELCRHALIDQHPHTDRKPCLARAQSDPTAAKAAVRRVRRFEAQGIPSNQAEAITAVITEVLNDSLENVAQSFVSKPEMQTSAMMQETALSKFKAEVQSSQDHHFSLLQHETEKLRTAIDKMQSELRYEIDKVTASQRLDLNLERGRIHEELADQNAETSTLTNKLDREIHTLKTQMEAGKYDVIKYCIGTIVSVTAVGLGLLRVLL